MIAEKVLYGARTLKACGFDGRSDEEKAIRKDVVYFLEKRFADAMAIFAKRIEATKAEIANLALPKVYYYREPQKFTEAWQVTEIPAPLAVWGHLSAMDPQKTGILCGTPEKPVALVEEDLKHIWEIDGASEALELWRDLSRWREAICAVWAATIVHEMILMTRGKKAFLLPPGNPGTAAKKRPSKQEDQIGAALALADVTDKEAEEFHELCDKAHMGSASCEYGAVEGLRLWLRSASIGTLKNAGLSMKEARMLMVATDQAQPRMDVELRWNQELGNYRFECVTKNQDVHGYTDEKKCAGVPANIIMQFFEDAAPKAREDMIRLVLRAGHSKARELLFEGLERSLD